ncbi:hypothetical protein HY358_00225 [Candidatus Roizmanbacteria bacterium]|nr:hypothetical protein [Candidatus Roizmanbacteria bacterium]
MNEQKVVLELLAMDLRRVALGIQRGSFAMAKRFADEALKRKQEIDEQRLDPYMVKLLNSLDNNIVHLEKDRVGEDALMFSVLIQNYALTKCK